MFGLFKKKRGHSIERHEIVTKHLKPLDYPPKVIVAWAKAIEGNQQLMRWLKENDYFELCMATYAIHLKEEARSWLSQNGYAHLHAFINASEGVKSAQKWLQKHKLEQLFHMAMFIEEETESLHWLQQNATEDILFLTYTIKKIKDKIEENHNDIHTFRKDI